MKTLLALLFFAFPVQASIVPFIVHLPNGGVAVSQRDMPPGYIICFWQYMSEEVTCLKATGTVDDPDTGKSWAILAVPETIDMPPAPTGG